MRELLIATRNLGKRGEILTALDGLPFTFLTLDDVDAGAEVEETGSTLAENAALKAKTYAERTGKLTIADDTGLEVDALGGRPGVHSARYCEGSMARGIDKLLGEMKDVPDGQRGATFRAIIAIYDPASKVANICEGSVRGTIAHEARGPHGFGYDPIFEYESKGKTGGEMTLDEKNRYSHRGRALAKARDILIAEFAQS